MLTLIGYLTGMFVIPAFVVFGVITGIVYLRTKDLKVAMRKALSWGTIGLVLGLMLLIFLSQLL